MLNKDDSMGRTGIARALRTLAAFAALVMTTPTDRADAESMMKLVAPAKEYTLRGYRYAAPQFDGWRQDAVNQQSLSLVYAEEPTPGQIDIRFGVVFEAHPIPENVKVEGPAAIAEASRKQMAEKRKADILAQSPVEAVPGTESLYTYRFLVRTPSAENPKAYEVYYVGLSPDHREYVVAECITRNEEYASQEHFQQFFGSLASLKWKGPAAAPAAAAATPPEAGKP